MSSTQQSRWGAPAIIATIVIVFIVIRGILWVTQSETVTMSVNHGYTPEAKRNPYLAAQQFLEKKQIPSSSVTDISIAQTDLKDNDALVILNNRPIAEIYHDTLLDWVSQGGHLIITAELNWDVELSETNDPLLETLGVAVEDASDSYDDSDGEDSEYDDTDYDAYSEQADSNKESWEGQWEQHSASDDSAADDAAASDNESSTDIDECAVDTYNNVSTIDYDSDQPPLQVNFSNQAHLADLNGETLNTTSYYPNKILQYTRGDGMITVLAEQDFWSNREIGWYDHAFFLWLLVSNSENVWFVYDTESPSLFSLIIKYLLEPFLCGLLLLALFLWYRGKRFGPILPEPEVGRRSLEEHLTASARFSWRQGDIHLMIQKLREDIKYRFGLRHGHHSSPQEIITILAKSSGLSPDEVQQALECEAPERETEFIHLMRLLQQVRNSV